jgi:3-hydroxymyristoyl/3-hydroxydecanoyl-(acyl carrier protein) dehydratase
MIRRDLDVCVEDVRLGENEIHARCRYPTDLTVIDGHFPTYPVIPGVYGLELSLHLLPRLIEPPPPPYRILKAKFARPIVPDMPFTVDIVVDTASERVLNVKTTLREVTDARAVLSRFSMRLGEAT